MILSQPMYISCSIKAGAVGYAYIGIGIFFFFLIRRNLIPNRSCSFMLGGMDFFCIDCAELAPEAGAVCWSCNIRFLSRGFRSVVWLFSAGIGPSCHGIRIYLCEWWTANMLRSWIVNLMLIPRYRRKSNRAGNPVINNRSLTFSDPRFYVSHFE